MEPSQATEHIRRVARGHIDLHWTSHAKERIKERGLIMGDILHVLKNGFVFYAAMPATQMGFFKYAMESTSPNSGGRTIRVVVIPSTSNAIKIITVMWKDEQN